MRVRTPQCVVLLMACGQGGGEALRVVATSPVDQTTGVAPEATIRATFSADVAPESLNAESFTIELDGGAVSGSVIYDAEGRTAIFAPASGMAPLGVHTATIAMAVSDLDGHSLEDDYSWTFEVRDRQWGDAETIDTGAGDAAMPQLASGGAVAVAVWRQQDGGRFGLFSNRYERGEGWIGEVPIDPNGTSDAIAPDVAMDAAGDVAVAAWHATDGARYNVWSSAWADGTWQPATLVELDDAGYAADASVGVAGNGTAVAVWRQSDGADESILANTYSSSSDWGTAVPIGVADPTSSPQVGVDVQGRAVAVWHASDGVRTNIWASRYDSGWAAAELLETDDAGDALFPQVAINVSGQAMAVWWQFDGTRNHIWAAPFDAEGGWGAPEQLEVAEDMGACYPRVGVGDAGDAVAVWLNFDLSGRGDVWASQHDPVTGWAEPTLVEVDETGTADVSKVAVDADGHAVAVWPVFDGTQDNIFAGRLIAGSGWGDAVPIEASSGSASSPQVVVDASGDAIAVWTQSDGITTNVWANLFR